MRSKKKLKSDKNKIIKYIENLGFNVVTGKGDFQHGSCLVLHEKKIVINQYIPIEAQNSFLVEFINDMNLESDSFSDDFTKLLSEY